MNELSRASGQPGFERRVGRSVALPVAFQVLGGHRTGGGVAFGGELAVVADHEQVIGEL
jgi:hypothetical protein